MDAKFALGEPRLLISRAALLHNAKLIRSRLRPETRVCAIVKADAYGLGAAVVVDALCNFSDTPASPVAASTIPPAVDELAVATIDEAAALPDEGMPVQILRPIENAFVGRERQRLELAIRSGWTLTVCSPAAADDLARVAMLVARRADVQVMVDTGMTRGGCPVDDLPDLIAKIESRPSLRLVGLCTHFVNGEVPDDPRAAEQVEQFRSATDAIALRYGDRLTRHVANTGGVFCSPESHLDMVRPGIGLYGVDPACAPNLDRPLRPVMKWLAPLIDVRDVRRGTTVGYNATFTAPRDTRVGLVPCGYADGYPRALSGVGVTLVGGRPAPVVGRVSMDLLTIDLSQAPHATVGDDVTLIDSDPLSPASIYEVARRAGTIPYEILCRIGPRVRRVAVDPTDPVPAMRPTSSGWDRMR